MTCDAMSEVSRSTVPNALFDHELLADVRNALGRARLDQLLTMFGQELATRPRIIREALADRDLSRAAFETHSLKGAAACLGAQAVADAARQLERAIAAAKAERGRGTSPALRRMTSVIRATRHALPTLHG